MATKQSDTSITDAAARRFLDREPERATLWCDRITGFHLLKLKKGGSWRYKYTDAAGRRRVATVARYPAQKPAEAAKIALKWRQGNKDVLAERAKERKAALTEQARSEQRTLRAYLDGGYAKHQGRKRAGSQTLAIIRNNFGGYLDRDMASLAQADVKAWQEKREAEGIAHATLKRAYGALKTMLRRAVKDGILAENPLAQVSLEPPTDVERGEQLSSELRAARRLLTPDEIQGLYQGLDAFADEIRQKRRNSRTHGKPHLPDLDAVAHPHWFIPFAYCALYTGLRPGDLYSLTWSELNVNFGRLVKVPQKTRHHESPARITMDLVPDLHQVMREWWEQMGSPQTGLVFPSPNTGEQMGKQAHNRAWPRVKQLGGLPADLDFYALRHHFISSLVANGVPLLTVAQLVGQKSAQMIENHYGHLCPNLAADALAAFSQSVARKDAV